jgi:photosynthetic reaction center H subunit
MGTGAITQYVDVAQLVLYAFWIFFAGLVYYLVRENHREGYPMDSGRKNGPVVTGWPVPPPKVFKTEHGDMVAPDLRKDAIPLALAPVYGTNAAPFEPTGDPMTAGVGPGSWTPRADRPDVNGAGEVRIRPLRVLADYGLSPKDIDPRGLQVIAADNQVAGTVRDAWVDIADMLVRYLEVSISAAGGSRNVLLPVNFARIVSSRGQPHVRVEALLASQYAGVPGTASPDQITLLEEEKICAYYGGGLLYATPQRLEPMA